MRKVLIFLISTTFIVGCNKNDNKTDNLQLTNMVPGGCAVDNMKSLKSSNETGVDTVKYSISQNKLDLFVGFNATCCGKYDTKTIIRNDSILINITASQIGLCNCICYYTYDFNFSWINKTQNYLINIDNYKIFKGIIKQ